MTGLSTEQRFRSEDDVEKVYLDTKTMQYLYGDSDSFMFMDTSTYDQVGIPKSTIGESADYMPENINVEVLFFNGRAVGVSLPNFIEQAIVSTDPGFAGNTATGATKPARISTGATINVPLFINVGDVIKIDTRTGQYLERLSRA